MMKEAMFALKTHSNEYLSSLHGTLISVLLSLLQNADIKPQQNKIENKQNTKKQNPNKQEKHCDWHFPESLFFSLPDVNFADESTSHQELEEE